MLKRIKDLTVVADVHASNVSVVDGAEPPGGPSSPDRNRDVMTAWYWALQPDWVWRS